jgi:HEAT repeat protein
MDTANKAALSTADLIARALVVPDTEDDAYWDCVRALHLRGRAEVFEAACALCTSDNPHKRELGADILAQAAFFDERMRDQAVHVLITTLEHETNLDVVYSLCCALGHRHDERAIASLMSWARHPDPQIRFGVVFALLGHAHDDAIKTLIQLSADPDDEVRDWATFGLGTQIEDDTPAIRAALTARLADPHKDTRDEALVGLAHRHDPGVIDPLLRELQSGYVGQLDVEAARQMADPRLYPALIVLQEWWDVDPELLSEALAACRPETSAYEDTGSN